MIPPERLEAEKAKVIAAAGPWTAHNVHLAGGVYTMRPAIVGDEVKLRRITQAIADVAQRPLRDLRVLDLACLEGLYGIELARHGADVVAVEAREANLAKARFAKDALGLANLTLLQDDVRNVSLATHGAFDVVLCLGILYHLDAPDVFTFVERLAGLCRGFALFDTHVSLAAETSHTHAGHTYAGRHVREHGDDATAVEKAARLRASLDNTMSFWPTAPSLYNLLRHAGFTSVWECRLPPEPDKPVDRTTLLAIKGTPQPLLSAPLMSGAAVEDLPEVSRRRGVTAPAPAFGVLRAAARRLPRPVKRLLRSLAGR
ncbi:MAG: methyltransferase domain-containing protein [Candidatus Rokubacteria bacterium]|nr:methyltransferase domain-containing protein [Candidatus Rokubacteria bacterium]